MDKQTILKELKRIKMPTEGINSRGCFFKIRLSSKDIWFNKGVEAAINYVEQL